MNTVENWLERKCHRQRTLALLLMPLALLSGLLVTFVTFWLFYALIYMMGMGISAAIDLVASNNFKIVHSWRLVLAGAWLSAVIVGYARRPMSSLEPMPDNNYVSWSPTFHGGGSIAGLVMMAAYPGATAHLLRDLFQTGPRLLHGAFALWRMNAALKSIQPDFCATYLDCLVRSAGALTWEELASINGSDRVGPAVAQLRAIEGVVFLEKGVSITSDLRRELRPLLPAGVSSSAKPS